MGDAEPDAHALRKKLQMHDLASFNFFFFFFFSTWQQTVFKSSVTRVRKNCARLGLCANAGGGLHLLGSNVSLNYWPSCSPWPSTVFN